MFDCVVAADRAWGIGKNNALPWPKLKGDMAHFKRITCEAPEGRRNAIVQGRRTWESAEVQGRPLPRRINIIVSRGAQALPDGVLAARSLDDALAAAAAVPDIATTFVIGGAQLLREALVHPGLRYVYFTRIDAVFDCDTFLPDLDALGFVEVAWDGAFTQTDNAITYRVQRLARS